MLTINELVGKNIPSPGDAVYAVRKKLKRNKNGRFYTSSNDTDLEIVHTTIMTVAIIQDMEGNLQWYATAYGNRDNQWAEYGGIHIVEGNYSYNKETAQELLEHLKKTGLKFEHFAFQLIS